MRFEPEDNLLPPEDQREHYLFRLPFSFKPIWVHIVFCSLIFVANRLVLIWIPYLRVPFQVAFLVLLTFFFWNFMASLFSLLFNRLEVTNHNLSGYNFPNFLPWNRLTIPLKTISRTEVRTSLPGHLLNYGKVILYSDKNERYSFLYIEDPSKVKKALDQAISQAKK